MVDDFLLRVYFFAVVFTYDVVCATLYGATYVVVYVLDYGTLFLVLEATTGYSSQSSTTAVFLV